MNKIILEFKEKNKEHNFKYVFFDIFDTIVTRNVEPEYVKKIWSTNLVKHLKLNIEPFDLYDIRNKAEAYLCQATLQSGKDLEFKYVDMIEKIYDELTEKYLLKIKYNDFEKICIETEIEVENASQVLVEETIELIKYLKKRNIIIYCLSDMYLTKKMISEIFNRKDILKYFDDIFMSEEKLISKKTGKFYRDVLDRLNIDAKEALMIGDNPHSDYDMAIANGLSAININMNHKKGFNENFLSEVSVEKIKLNIKNIANNEKVETFSDTVFSLYSFIEKLYYGLLNKGAKDVVFFSREGQFLKKIFDEYQSTIYNRKINTHYAIVSRKSTYIASLKPIDDEDFSSLLDQYSYNSIDGFIKSLNFDDQEISRVFSSLKNKIDVDKKVHYFKNSKKLEILKKNKTFREIYEEKRIDQKNKIVEYFNEFNLIDNKNLFIVDIGWKGSIQSNISRIMSDTNVYGYYFGLILHSQFKEDREGLIFSNVPSISNNFNLFNENKSLYEILLGASHGSALYYEKTGKNIIAKTYETKEESDLFNNIILPIQNEMFVRFVKIKKTLQNRIYNEKEIAKIFNKIQYNMLFVPNKDSRMFFNKIYHYENFGVFEFTNFTGKHNYKNKIWELGKYILRNDKYISDYYWPQLKNFNNKMYSIAIMYAIQRYLEFKKKELI